MHLTREADYAIRIMYILAKNDRLTDALAISEAVVVSRRFVLKILSKLGSAGLVSSKLGAGGGYFLARSARDISVADILEAIEGTVMISTCLVKDYRCERVEDCSDCVFHCMFAELNVQFVNRLRKITVADALRLRPKEMAQYIQNLT